MKDQSRIKDHDPLSDPNRKPMTDESSESSSEKGQPAAGNAPSRAKRARSKSSSSSSSTSRRGSAKNLVSGYKYDWASLREQFIEGVEVEGQKEREFLNLVQLAERTDVPLQRIRERAAEERWYDQREQYQLKVAKQRQTRRVLELAGQSVEFDSRALETAKLGMHVVTTRMQEIAAEIEELKERRDDYLARIEAGEDIPEIDMVSISSAIDARELEMLARAAIAWQQLGHKAMGTDVTRMEIQHDIQANIDVDVEVTSISAELSRDDPERLAAFLQAAKRAGLLDTGMTDPVTGTETVEVTTETLAIGGSNDDIIDAEIVDVP